MSRELLIIRHAKSSWSEAELDDFDRPLKKRGKEDAERLGAYLQKNNLQPNWVLCSGAKRATQTLKAMRHALQMDDAMIEWKDRLYMAQPAILLRELSQVASDKSRVMLVGHNPGLEELLLFLCNEPPPRTNDGKLLTTAAFARIQLPDSWSQLTVGCGKLIKLQLARQLTKNS